MKKSLLFLSLAGAITAQAQITLTSADMITPSNVLLQANDSTVSGISMGSAGTSQTWNMSALGMNSQDTLTVMPYSAMPNPKFAGANLVIKYGYQQIYNYMNNSASMLKGLGIGAMVDFGAGLTQLNQVSTPYETLMPYPSTYGTSFTDNHVNSASFYYGASGVDSIRMRSRIQKTSTADAWGTITTPLGTFASLRFMEVSHNWDTTEYYVGALGGWQTGPGAAIPPQVSQDSSKSYTWWANSVGFPIAQATVDYTTLMPTGITWLSAYPMPVGVNELTANALEINVYPNPAQDQVNFMVDSEAAAAVQIFDITGRQIGAFGITSDLSTISTSAYANGIYTYVVIGKDAQVVTRGKFSVAK
ncbi:MAG: hypothetical protein JWO09_1532 [Bacteroidetes bacterium]|nr:hypothetical protein [Bacteroidota bacterium]